MRPRPESDHPRLVRSKNRSVSLRGSGPARGGLALLSWLTAFALPVVAQTAGSVAVGGSVVEYDGFLASGAAVIAPTFRFDSRVFSFGGQGSWTLFESGSSVLQGSLAAAWVAAARGAFRFELSSSAGASVYRDEQSSGHLLGGARMHLLGNSAGAWIGATAGRSYGTAGVPLELAATVWSVRNRLTFLGTVTGTLHDEVRYVDFLGAVRWISPRLELEARLGARPWGRNVVNAEESLTGAYGELDILAPLNRWLSLTLSGGKYRADPVRRTLGAQYISAGLRLGALGRSARRVGLEAEAPGGRVVPREVSAPRLEIRGQGERKILTIRAPGASTVELMGDFTDWTPVRLSMTEPGVWKVELELPTGVYRMNIRLDGGRWVVPGAARVERTEFGGEVGVVVVP